MKILHVATEAGDYALYDPQAMLDDVNAPWDSWLEKIPERANAGLLALYAAAADGETQAAIFIDERPDAKVASWKSTSVRGVLHVPSGRLVFGGVESMQADPPVRDGGAFEIDASTTSKLAVAPGAYEVEAFEVELPDDEVKALDAAVAREAGGTSVAVRNALGVGFGCSFLFLGLVVLFLLALALTGGASSVIEAVRSYGLVVIGVPVFIIALNWLPFVARVDRAQATVALTVPHVAFVLTRLPEGTNTTGRTGVAFGPGVEQREGGVGSTKEPAS